MKHKLATFIALIAVLSAVMTFASYADVGNFASNSDWGDSGGSSGGSSDWGSNSNWNDDYSSGATTTFDGDDDSFFVGAISLGTIIIIIIIAMTIKQKKRNPGGASSTVKSAPTLPLLTLKEKDPNFSEPEFVEMVGNYYIQMQNAWQAKKFEPMRAVFTDALYNQLLRQLNELVANNQTNKIERIAILSANLLNYAQDQSNDILTVDLRTRIVDYTIDDKTGAVINGSNTQEKYMAYEWTLVRAKDRVTLPKDELSEVNCPNCGAPMSINQSSKCEYCGAVVTLKDHDWAVSAIRGISQHS